MRIMIMIMMIIIMMMIIIILLVVYLECGKFVAYKAIGHTQDPSAAESRGQCKCCSLVKASAPHCPNNVNHPLHWMGRGRP
jgi:hypothetical protein